MKFRQICFFFWTERKNTVTVVAEWFVSVSEGLHIDHHAHTHIQGHCVQAQFEGLA